MDKMISTKALHGDYLAHARVYSHKYISRKPDGKGGWIYTYPTMSSYNKPAYTSEYTQSDGTIVRQYHPGVKGTTVAYTRGSNYDGNAFYTSSSAEAKKYREAKKAHTIYYEGIGANNETGMNGYPADKSNQKTSQAKNDSNVFQRTISSISQTAKNTIDAGKKFLSSIFTNPITETYTIKDTNNKVIASGTRNSNLSEVGKDLVNAGKKWLSNIITTKKTITITDK